MRSAPRQTRRDTTGTSESSAPRPAYAEESGWLHNRCPLWQPLTGTAMSRAAII